MSIECPLRTQSACSSVFGHTTKQLYIDIKKRTGLLQHVLHVTEIVVNLDIVAERVQHTRRAPGRV